MLDGSMRDTTVSQATKSLEKMNIVKNLPIDLGLFYAQMGKGLRKSQDNRIKKQVSRLISKYGFYRVNS
jgi:hypothetical protein